MLWQMAGFHAFFLMAKHYSIVCAPTLLYPSSDGHLGGFRILTIIHLAMNMGVHVSFIIISFCFLQINTQKWNSWIIW